VCEPCFAADELALALGVTSTGEKHVLGFVQTATENERVMSQFLRSLVARGLDTSSGLLVVIDGSKGLRGDSHGVAAACGGAALSVAQAGERRLASAAD
jgi:hypothetical protein